MFKGIHASWVTWTLALDSSFYLALAMQQWNFMKRWVSEKNVPWRCLENKSVHWNPSRVDWETVWSWGSSPQFKATIKAGSSPVCCYFSVPLCTTLPVMGTGFLLSKLKVFSMDTNNYRYPAFYRLFVLKKERMLFLQIIYLLFTEK